ncbi:hypothetical protein [Caulobacter sp.]|uniref:hypothetical protein n=1 Tax=Caulobacter sp. TaxID=78 RepID=UPI0016099422
MFEQLDRWVIWFDFVSSEMMSSADGKSSEDIAKAILERDGIAANDAAALKERTRQVSQYLGNLSRWGLVSGKIVSLKKENSFFSFPVQLASLLPSGEKLARLPNWRKRAFFARKIIINHKAFKAIQPSIAVAGSIVTVLKMIFLWNDHHVIIAASIGAFLTFFIKILRSTHAS